MYAITGDEKRLRTEHVNTEAVQIKRDARRMLDCSWRETPARDHNVSFQTAFRLDYDFNSFIVVVVIRSESLDVARAASSLNLSSRSCSVIKETSRNLEGPGLLFAVANSVQRSRMAGFLHVHVLTAGWTRWQQGSVSPPRADGMPIPVRMGSCRGGAGVPHSRPMGMAPWQVPAPQFACSSQSHGAVASAACGMACTCACGVCVSVKKIPSPAVANGMRVQAQRRHPEPSPAGGPSKGREPTRGRLLKY